MSFSGDIGDVSVADTLQFIHLGGRSGTLRLARGEEKAEIGFHHGRIVKAVGPDSKLLGEVLVELGLVPQATLDEALAAQQKLLPRQTLGQILVEKGALEADAIYRVIEQQIQSTVRELVLWDHGNFEFALDELRPMDDVGIYPGDIVKLNVDTQMVLLDALRLFDERNRDQKAQPPPPWTPTPATGTVRLQAADPKALPELPRPPAPAAIEPATAPPRLQIVSADPKLAENLRQVLKVEDATLVRMNLREAGIPPPGEPPPFVLLDLREGGAGLDALKGLRRARPRSGVIALVDPGTPTGPVYEAGALAVLDANLAVIAACFRNAVQNRPDLWTAGTHPELVKENYAKLRRIVGDLRSGLISTTISLSLMNIISESVERAVLFLVRRAELGVLGAFGAGEGGQSLALLTRGMRLPLSGDCALVECLNDGQVRSLRFEDARLPESFMKILGPPRSGHCAVFPVLGGQQVIAVVYADNGFSNTAIEQVEMLELAAVQAGLALENELLRRQLGQNREPPSSRS